MKNNRLSNDLWSRIVVNRQIKVLEATSLDDRLLFGHSPAPGDSLFVVTTPENLPYVGVVAKGIERAFSKQRNTRFEYPSVCASGHTVHVCAHAQYLDDDTVCLYLTPLHEEERAQNRAEEDYHHLLQTIYENLPIGVEIYDANGWMIGINPHEMQEMGIKNIKDVLGLNLFENPNLPSDAKKKLLNGESVRFTVAYDFDLVRNYYDSSATEKRELEVMIKVMRDAKGAIDKYLIISQDITDRIRLQKKYASLFNQNETVLNSLPVGVELYANDGTLLYINKTDSQIFGVDRDHLIANPVNIHDNPNPPQDIKDAVRNGHTIITRYPHNMQTVADTGYYESSLTQQIQIECNGRPIINDSGEVENYIFIVSDVTEAVHREEELRQNRRKTELAIQASGTTIWEFDVKDRLFYSDNEPMNGYDRTKPIDIELYIQTTHPEEQAAMTVVMQKMMAGEEHAFSFEARICYPGTSEWQYCTITGSPYERDADGRVVKYVGSRKDNTELQKRKMLQDKILNSIPLPIHIKDIEDNFRYVFCNDESKKLFSTSEDKTTYDVMEVQEVERIQKTDMEVFTTGNPYLGLERIVLKDGRSYDTIVRKSVFFDGNKRLLLSIRWDQSLQKDLERRAKLLALTMENMNAYTWFYDPSKDKVSFGEGFDKVCPDFSQVDSVEKFAKRIHPEDRGRFMASIETALEGENGKWYVEYRADLSQSGIYEWWETRGALETSMVNDAPYDYLYGMTISIEGHKQTELTLVRNKEELNQLIRQNELVLNNTNSGLAYITTDYMVQWENISICSASLSHEAYKRGEVCYKSTYNRTSPCENCVLQRAMVSHQMERIKFTLGNGRMVEVFATPVFNDNQTIDGIVIRLDDVTERERMIAEIRQAKALAEQSDKLKSAFLANMSHEIRTPLNAIVGFSELLMTTTEPEDKEEYMQIINNNNDLLLKLINDILDLSKIEAGSVELKYETFDLSEYFDGMTASMKQRIKNPNVRLVATNPYPVCMVNLDRNRVAQILTNYVTNAIKYTPKGFIEMGYEHTAVGIRFYVKDTGIGISDEKKPKVFHRFEKLDEFAQGTGLGLSICKAITESMGGRVGFESTSGEGSLFWAELPCDPQIEDTIPHEQTILCAGETDAPEKARVELPDDNSRRTILVAEDIPSNYLLVSAILHKHFNLRHAANGQEAVEIARKGGVDLVLMDMKMPVMDGLTATAGIRAFAPELPIIALTAHAFEADRQAALAAGCNDYLVKPINKAQLMAVLQKYSLATIRRNIEK